MTLKPGDICWNYYGGKNRPEVGKMKVKLLGDERGYWRYELVEPFVSGPAANTPADLAVGYVDYVSDIHLELVDQELKINFIVTGESQFGRWFEYTAIDEEDGKATARALSKGLAKGYKINLTKVYTTPSPESIDF